MEGILLVPPDRGTIIGRAIWKPRYVVVGPQDARPGQLEQLLQSSPQHQRRLPSSSARSHHSQTPRASTPRSQPVVLTATESMPLSSPLSMHLSIFKSKDDREPVQQYALSSINDCQVQMLSHRKQGPVLPTLVLGISPDPVTDKIRKRRSSRTAGLTTREIVPATLWFRPAEEHNQKHILQEWCHAIQALLTELGSSSPSTAIMGGGLGPLSSPVTPASPTFSNPFAPSPHQIQSQPLPQSRGCRRLGSEASVEGRAGILSQKTAASNQTSKSSHTHGHAHASRERERSKTYSESPSLRSRRSDLSHTSSNIPPHAISTPAGYSSNSSHNNYVGPFFQTRPTDLPSPATTVNEFQGDQVEGWTNALSRLSVSASTTSASLATKATAASNSSSPPAPRETILDRAFQLRYIPGSDRDPGGEEKLSSLARFDALMREEEERRRLRLAQAASASRAAHPDTEPKSGWDFDDDDDDDDEGADDDDEDDDADNSDDDDGSSVVRSDGASSASGSHRQSRRGRQSEGIHMRRDHLEPVVEIAPNTRRALEFIAGRHDDVGSSFGMPSPRARVGSSSYDAHALRTPDNGQRLHESRHRHRQVVEVEEDEEQRQQQGEQLSRPKTGYSRSRPAITQRTHSQPHLAALNRPSQPQPQPRMASGSATPPSLPRMTTAFAKANEIQIRAKTPAGTHSASPTLPLPLSVTSTTMSPQTSTPTADKRPSIANSKHLSFTEFTKRLSGSTGTLILAQANTGSSSGSGSSGVSHESDIPVMRGGSAPAPVPTHQHTGSSASCISSPLLPPSSQPPPPPAERCGWRGSVNVLSSEGGFL